MTTCGEPAPYIFQEAVNHCRWKTVLKQQLPTIEAALPTFRGETFEEVFRSIHARFQSVKGVGRLSTYDVTAAICRYHDIPIQRVYVIGNGPKRAATLLGLLTRPHFIAPGVRLNTLDIQDVNRALQSRGIRGPSNLTDGDALESFLCNWQKGI